MTKQYAQKNLGEHTENNHIWYTSWLIASLQLHLSVELHLMVHMETAINEENHVKSNYQI